MTIYPGRLLRRKVHGFVSVFEPWAAPTPLWRCWCLWEMYCAVDSGSRWEVALSPPHEALFSEVPHGGSCCQNRKQKQKPTNRQEDSKPGSQAYAESGETILRLRVSDHVLHS